MIADAVLEGNSSAVADTILVVDDQPAQLLLIRRLLSRYGYNIITAASGTEAIGIVSTHPSPIALLLSDVVMPDMDGPAVAAAVQRIRPAVRTLFMSGYPPEVVVEQGILDADAPFLQKPFSAPALLEKLREVLGNAEREGG